MLQSQRRIRQHSIPSKLQVGHAAAVARGPYRVYSTLKWNTLCMARATQICGVIHKFVVLSTNDHDCQLRNSVAFECRVLGGITTICFKEVS